MKRALLTITLIFLTLAACTEKSPTRLSSSDIKWIRFGDLNHQVTFEYPGGWSIEGSTDPERGSPTVLISPVDASGKSYSITIGQYTNETISPDENLFDWATAHDRNAGMIDSKDRVILSRESMKISGLDAVYTVMSFPEARYADIRRGDKVLFIWANIGVSADVFYQDVFSHVLMSFASD